MNMNKYFHQDHKIVLFSLSNNFYQEFIIMTANHWRCSQVSLIKVQPNKLQLGAQSLKLKGGPPALGMMW